MSRGETGGAGPGHRKGRSSGVPRDGGARGRAAQRRCAGPVACQSASGRPRGERKPDYFVKDRPYLDGYKFFFSPETSVRAVAICSGRACIEFRNLPGAEVEAIKKQLGDRVGS